MTKVDILFLPSTGDQFRGIREFSRVPAAGELIAGMGLTGEVYVVETVEWQFNGTASLVARQQQ